MGFYVLKLDKNSRLNQIFFILSMAMAFWAFCYVFYYTMDNKNIAWFIYQISSLGRCMHPALLLLFVLVLTKRENFTKSENILKRQLLLFLIFIPPIICIFQTLNGNFVASDIINVHGVWNEVLISNGFWWKFYAAYFISFDVLSLYLILNWGRKTKSNQERKQALIIFYSTVIVMIFALILNTLLPTVHLYLSPATGQILGLGSMVGIWWAISHYRLMKISPSLAAQSIMDKITDLVILVDQEGIITEVNKKAETILGFKEEELKEQHWSFIVKNPLNRELLLERISMLIKSSSDESNDFNQDVLTSGIELIYMSSKREEIPFNVYLSLIKSGEEIIGYSVVGQDLRPMKKMEAEIKNRLVAENKVKRHLKEIESLNNIIVSMNHATSVSELLSNALHSTLDLLSFQKGGVFLIENNKAYLKIYKGFSKETISGFKVLHLDDMIYEKIMMSGETFITNELNFSIINIPSSVKIASLAVIPLQSHGDILGLMVVLNDRKRLFKNTEKEILESIGREAGATLKRIKSEEKIRNSLEEKEVLLKEIHHRVKNNMQIISSLLNLQMAHVEDSEAVEVLRESQGRVASMAMVHEKLYGTDNLRTINLKNYFSDLMETIMLNYQHPFIELDVKSSDIKLNIDTIMPLGLIANELITNAFKYAFSGRRDGKIKLEVLDKGENNYQFILEDNGVGMSENIEINSKKTLGLLLVKNLVSQLHGSYEIERKNGTRFIIDFKEIKYKKRI